ncbi:hypothetical protein ASC97_32160 [Rhizobium sp. Root1203]|uniref:hypothetical protein n=1 Tax=Rhizobium sp. Root1203 TaxID=1736427 RepID=UPI00070F240B|nr:hypothetical protein [Rhizobium sp. Root1203]KQV13191.1 hypothetical protein ASC97_32160 [Rhizobium sp. Root1203]
MTWKIFAVIVGLINFLGAIVVVTRPEATSILEVLGYVPGAVAGVLLGLYAFDIAVLDLRVLKALFPLLSGYFVICFAYTFWGAYTMLVTDDPKVPAIYVMGAVPFALTFNALIWLAVWRYCRGQTCNISAVASSR